MSCFLPYLQVIYQCDDPDAFLQSSTRVCLKCGEWSGDTPSCFDSGVSDFYSFRWLSQIADKYKYNNVDQTKQKLKYLIAYFCSLKFLSCYCVLCVTICAQFRWKQNHKNCCVVVSLPPFRRSETDLCIEGMFKRYLLLS